MNLYLILHKFYDFKRNFCQEKDKQNCAIQNHLPQKSTVHQPVLILWNIKNAQQI